LSGAGAAKQIAMQRTLAEHCSSSIKIKVAFIANTTRHHLLELSIIGQTFSKVLNNFNCNIVAVK
jgi:hypothetical protein